MMAFSAAARSACWAGVREVLGKRGVVVEDMVARVEGRAVRRKRKWVGFMGWELCLCVCVLG